MSEVKHPDQASRILTLASSAGLLLSKEQVNVKQLHERLSSWLAEDRGRGERFGSFAYTTVRNYVLGLREAPLGFLLALQGAFGWRADWIQRGEGASTVVDQEILSELRADINFRFSGDSADEADGQAKVFRSYVQVMNRIPEIPAIPKLAIAGYLRELWTRGELSEAPGEEEAERRVRGWFSTALEIPPGHPATAAIYSILAARYMALDQPPSSGGTAAAISRNNSRTSG